MAESLTLHGQAKANTQAGAMLGSARVSSIERLSAVDSVRARVILAVDIGLISPGDKLPSPGEMAEAFGVSQSSIVRGLTRLQNEGILIRRAGRYGGTYVSDPLHIPVEDAVQPFLEDHSTVHELIDERAVLEAGFAALAATHRSASELERLAELIDSMDHTQSWAEFRNLDRAFHRCIIGAAHTPFAEPLANRINTALDPYFLPYNMQLLHDSNGGHRKIYAALKSGDAGAAATLTAAHIQELHTSMYVAMRGAPGPQ